MATAAEPTWPTSGHVMSICTRPATSAATAIQAYSAWRPARPSGTRAGSPAGDVDWVTGGRAWHQRTPTASATFLMEASLATVRYRGVERFHFQRRRHGEGHSTDPRT